MMNLKKKYLHWKWQHRYNKAWNIACHKAYDDYNEDITTCNPLYYFYAELVYSKKLPEEFYNKHNL